MQKVGLLFGTDLLKRRETIIPSFKNFKNMKYFPNIRKYYDLGRKLGEGQYGEVVRVKKKGTQKEYAMKKIKKRAINTP